jgi:hypothetical protein
MANFSVDVVADDQGNWEAPFAANQVTAGLYTAEITATTTDPYGNVATARDSVEVDTRVDDLSIVAGEIAGENIISAAEYNGTVTVTGTTKAGSRSVLVTMGGVTVAANGASSGNWTATFDADILPAGTGTHTVGVLATDGAGNTKPATATVRVDTEVAPFTMTSDPTGTDDTVNIAEASAGIDLGGTVEIGSTVTVRFDGKNYEAEVNTRTGEWSLTVPPEDIREGQYEAAIRVEAKDHVGNVARINETLSIDTQAPNGPIVTSLDEGRDEFYGLSVQAVMENGTLVSDAISVVEVEQNGTISEVEGSTRVNGRGQTEYEFDGSVPNGSHLIVNATDDAGNTSGTYFVQDTQSGGKVIDLSNTALGQYEIQMLDLDWADAATVTIDEASLLALSSETNALTIRGSVDDQVTISNGRSSGTEEINGEMFNVFTVGDEGTLYIDAEVRVLY